MQPFPKPISFDNTIKVQVAGPSTKKCNTLNNLSKRLASNIQAGEA